MPNMKNRYDVFGYSIQHDIAAFAERYEPLAKFVWHFVYRSADFRMCDQ